MDAAREQDILEPSAPRAYRVNWFHAERPVAGTTYRRQADSQPRPVTTAEDTASR